MKRLPLTCLAQINPSGPPGLKDSEIVCFVPMSAFTEQPGAVLAEELRTYGEVKKGFTPFLSGDILFAKITPCFENGKIGQAILSRENGFGSTEFHVIRAKAGKADARFLHHFLRNPQLRVEGMRRMTGSAGQRRVPKSFLESLLLPDFDIYEQRRIAAILDKAEELITKRRAALALLDQLPHAIFLEMFGDPATNLKNWPLRKLEEITKFIRNGKSIKQSTDAGGLPITRIETISQGTVNANRCGYAGVKQEEVENYLMNRGDILFSHINSFEHVGKVAIYEDVPRQLVHGMNLLCLRPDEEKSIAEFLLQLLRSSAFRSSLEPYINKAVNQASVSASNLKAIKIPLPPLDQQSKFAAHVDAIHRAKTAHHSTLAELDALFSSLQHGLFCKTTNPDSLTAFR